MGVGEEAVGVFFVGEGLVAAWFAAAAGHVLGRNGTGGFVEGVLPRLEGGDLVSCWFQSGVLGGVLVADIFRSRLSPFEEPSESSANVFDQVPWIESVHQGFGTQAPALVGGFWVKIHAGGGFGGDDLGASDVVYTPWEGPQVENAKKCHFDAEEKRRDSDFDIWRLYAGGGFDGACGSEEGDEELWRAYVSNAVLAIWRLDILQSARTTRK